VSDELLLFGILCLIYVTDCFVWIGRHSLAFVTWNGRQWRDKAPSQIIKTSKGGLLLTNPFTPLGKIICCHLPPLSISPKGISSLNCQALTHNDVPEKEIASILFKDISDIKVDGRDILINDSRFIRLRDDQGAEKLGVTLKSLHDTTITNREKIIHKFWDRQFDFDRAKETVNQIAKKMPYLRFLCNSLFLFLFILAPFFILYLQMTGMLIPIAVGMLVLAIQISIGFYILHKKYFPHAKEDRISNLIKMILCPPVSIRACDLITENLLGNYNPIIVGHLLLSRSQFRQFIERTVRNLYYPPLEYFTDRRADEISNWQNQFLLKKMMDYIRDVAKIEDNLLSLPQVNDPSVHSYCPRCLSQFTQEAGNCPDCPGVKLVAFKNEIVPPIKAEE